MDSSESALGAEFLLDILPTKKSSPHTFFVYGDDFMYCDDLILPRKLQSDRDGAGEWTRGSGA